MTAIASTSPAPADAEGLLSRKQSKAVARLRQLIWLYFWLLVFEGALRKWVLPSLANVILLVRDPVVIWAYVIALRRGLFPRHTFLMIGSAIAWLMLAAGMVVLPNNLPVVVFGLRTNFLHLPMIFLMYRLMDRDDVRRIGRWMLLLAIPMTLLMVAQFQAPQGAWINSGSDEAFKQIDAGGHVRAPGTFSFITGPINFYCICAAFILEGLYVGRQFPRWLLFAAAFATALAASISGSRGMTFGIGIVMICSVLIGISLRPRLLVNMLTGFVVAFALMQILMTMPVFHEGWAIMTARVENGGVQEGIVMRALGDLTIHPQMWYETPLLGYGLGRGTNVGAVLYSGERTGFQFGEGEWERVINESGPVLGIAYIALRAGLAIWLLVFTVSQVRRKNVLPFLLFGGIYMGLLNGQWGQAATQGFAAFGAGLCLAATNAGPRPQLPAATDPAGESELGPTTT